jgi:hypothetical protein
MAAYVVQEDGSKTGREKPLCAFARSEPDMSLATRDSKQTAVAVKPGSSPPRCRARIRPIVSIGILRIDLEAVVRKQRDNRGSPRVC